MSDELNTLRREIDAVDDELIRLFKRRMEISAKVSAYKRASGMPTLDAGRERKLLARIAELSGDDFAEYSESVYRAILAASRSYQNTLSGSKSRIYALMQEAIKNTEPLFPSRAAVACVGTDGSTAERICRRLFKLPTIMYFDTAEHALRAVKTGMCRFAMLEEETRLYDILVGEFYIARAAAAQEDIVLAARYGVLEAELICSDEHGFSQCRLQSRAEKKYFASMAEAACYVAEAERINAAAVCPRFTAEHYGLKIINDKPSSHAARHRYLCISSKLEIYPGADKSAFMISLPDRAGELARLAERFSALGVNIKRIQSRSAHCREYEAELYFETDELVYSPALEALLRDIESECAEPCYLGSFSEEVCL